MQDFPDWLVISFALFFDGFADARAMPELSLMEIPPQQTVTALTLLLLFLTIRHLVILRAPTDLRYPHHHFAVSLARHRCQPAPGFLVNLNRDPVRVADHS